MPPAPYPLPSREDAVVATAARVIGGPAGRHAAVGTRGLAGVAAALVALGTAALTLGVLQKGHCLLKGWSNPSQFWRTCYSDLPVLHVSTGLAERQLPLLGPDPTGQPLLSGLAMWLVALVSPRAGTGVAAQQWVFTVWAAVAVLLLALAVVAAVALRPGRPWQAAHLAVSPVLALLALVSTDLLGIALTLWALLAWDRRSPAAAGVLLGLAVLVRPYPLVVLAALALLAVREERAQDAVRVTVSATLGGLAVLLPFVAAAPDGTLLPLRAWWTTGPGYGAVGLVPQLLGMPLLGVATTTVAASGWLLALGLGAWLVRRGDRAPTPAQLAAPMLLIVLLTAQAVPVQTGLWVLPLLALSAVPWRDHLVWAGAEALHFLTVWLHIGFGSDPGRGLPGETYALAIGVRFAALAWVVWRVWAREVDDDARAACARAGPGAPRDRMAAP